MRQNINLNTKWAFSKEALAIPEVMPENWYLVTLPHTWNCIDGQDGGNDYYRGTCYYAKEFNLIDLLDGEIPKNAKYFIEFLGANSSADLYVNGKKYAHHDGGYSTWRVDITEALVDNKAFVSVAVDNSINEEIYPQQADFTFYGGLYRDVNLIVVPTSHFELDYYGTPGIKVTPEVKGTGAEIEIETFIANPIVGQELIYRIKDGNGDVVVEKAVAVSETKVTCTLSDAHLWNGVKDPYLYTTEVELVHDKTVLDSVRTRFGVRTFEIDPERGFILNGEEYPLRGVSRHQDFAGIGNALSKEHHDMDMELIRELGATTIRLAHYQHDQYFYDLCDEYGMVIWAEIPYISRHMPGGRENTISQMKELVIQNYNHPSIVVWGLSNEITMSGASDEDLIENHTILNDMCHEMDKTRLTTMAIVSMCKKDDPYIQIPDTVSWNHYFGWYGGDTSMNGPWLDEFHKMYPNLPVGMSEYGCEALDWHTSDPKQGDYTEEYQAYYHEELIKQLYTRPYIWATHVWNMFDFAADARNEGGENGMNHKGLVTFDRKYKKDAFYAYKAWLSQDPFVHICGKRYVDRVEEVTKVTVYSNLPEVELFINGKSFEKKSSAEHFFYFEVPNTGVSELRAVAGECTDESVICKVETFNEKYRLKEKGAILNWFDITEPEGYFSLNDKIGDIMANTEGAALMGSIFAKLGELAGSGEEKKPAFSMNEDTMKMMGGFTLTRLSGMLGVMNINVTKEQLLGLNTKLNKISK